MENDWEEGKVYTYDEVMTRLEGGRRGSTYRSGTNESLLRSCHEVEPRSARKSVGWQPT